MSFMRGAGKPIDGKYDSSWKGKSSCRAQDGEWVGKSSSPKEWRSSRSQLSSFNRGLENYLAPPPVIPPPLNHGWAQVASGQPSQCGPSNMSSPQSFDRRGDDNADDYDVDDDSEEIYDSDDELLGDEFDLDSSQKSHETRKKNEWFKAFFDKLDKLTVEEINESTLHCPACKGGPGAIARYTGSNPLIAHAKTIRSRRVKLHREFAGILDEEVRQRGTSVMPHGESFGMWNSLDGDGEDHEIVWPPMVIIMNTRLSKNEKGEWMGMGNPELLDYFGKYGATKARHSHGPQGHRGMSVLIFERSAIGYIDAENLDKLFRVKGIDREAWDRRPVHFQPGGKRQLYGFLAEKGDLVNFNQHSSSKSRLKFEMQSHQEMVVSQMKKMSEDNQQIICLKNKVAEVERHSKALGESFGLMSERYRKSEKEKRIIRQMSKMKHEEDKEAMDFQEQVFNELLDIQEQSLDERFKIVQEVRDAEEESFEKLQKDEREKVKQTSASFSSMEDHKSRVEEFIDIQEKEAGEFVGEREKLIKIHEDDKVAMKQRHREEEVELQERLNAMRKRHGEEKVEFEEKLNAELSRLMERYTPPPPNSKEGS